ncbi:glycoside hydrolase family 16 protein [Rhodococcus sp. HNM0569]|uniref:glycoside hydrolase family 16 protein n=1 Tax=Rhodococcus sp. HNM0569 TaxID=2716340 RepID=UPI001F10BE99|nr:glycoside hydrolase family 16 protein [Rhodococcus sp. HNM0569]
MRVAAAALCLLVLAVLGGSAVEQEGATRLPWSEEFEGPRGGAPDPDDWNFEYGAGGWGNDELQTYTDDPRNVYLDGNGHLVIAARSDERGITSVRMNTQGKFTFRYGTLAARIRLPAGTGLLPAFWLLGADFPEVGWPRSGEIDVIETPNDGSEYNASVHGPTEAGEHWFETRTGRRGVDLTDDFHVYSLTKAPGTVTMLIDDIPVATFTEDDLPDDALWVFEQPAFVLFTLAVGGDWPGPPDRTTPNPSYMIVDWIRAREDP